MNNEIDYGRSIGAVIGGFFTWLGLNRISLFLVGQLFLSAPPVGQRPTFTLTYLLSMLLIGFGVALIGGYVVGAIAGVYRFAHALVLAGIILALGLLVLALPAAAFPERDFFPVWYPYTSALTTPLGAAFGGWLRQRKAA